MARGAPIPGGIVDDTFRIIFRFIRELVAGTKLIFFDYGQFRDKYGFQPGLSLRRLDRKRAHNTRVSPGF